MKWYPLKDLTLFANYTYNISEVAKDENNANLQGNYLPNDPRHNMHIGLQYQNPRIINMTLLTNYYADIYYDNENRLKTGDYWTVDVSLSRKIFERFNLYVNAENIFDRKYLVFKSVSSGDTIAPGVIVTTGLKLEF